MYLCTLNSENQISCIELIFSLNKYKAYIIQQLKKRQIYKTVLEVSHPHIQMIVKNKKIKRALN